MKEEEIPDTPEDPPTEPATYTVTVTVNNGTVGGNDKQVKSGISSGDSFTSETLQGKSGYSGPYMSSSCNGKISSNKVVIDKVSKDVTCTVNYYPPTPPSGSANVTLVIGGDTGVSVPESTVKITENDSHTFTIDVPAPSDRYISSGNVTCNNSGITKSGFVYNWSNEVNNSKRTDQLTLKNASVSGQNVTCTIDYSARWVGIPFGSYKGQTLSYSGLNWTVVEENGNSARLALNSVATGSANKIYSDAGTWLSSEWLVTGAAKVDLNKDIKNMGLIPLSTGVYINSASGISDGLTSYNYYVGSNKFYNAAERNHKTLNKKALVTKAYTKDESMPSSIFNTGYSTSKIPIGIKTLSDANKDKYYINSSGELVFPTAGSPETSALPNSYYSDRYMDFGLYSSVSKSVGTCSSSSDTLCTIRWNNYYKVSVNSSGGISHEGVDLAEGYLHFDGNSLMNDTETFSFNLCGGSSHGKNLKLKARSSGGYTWTSPLGNSYNPEFTGRFRIASYDITYCPKSGEVSEYNQCTPKKVGVPHTRVYYLNTSSSCKSDYKKYKLTDLVKNIYYRPYLEVRKR